MKINNSSLIKRNNSTLGETIEMKVERIVNNGEPIADGAPIIYTDRRDGALPDYDIRTDRFDIAADAMDKVTRTKLFTRQGFYKPKNEEIGKPESIQAT